MSTGREPWLPTPAANLWFARKTVLVEAGGKLSADSSSWVRLLQRIARSKVQSVFGKSQQAPRAALVCVDCEKLLKAGSSESLTGAAKTLRARLEEISTQFGISFPVYTIFCKVDEVPYFDDFVATFTNEEGAQVLGVTLPISSGSSSGVYAELESKRLSSAFDSLFGSLADCRPGVLARERDIAKKPGAYEFPREFRKLRAAAVEFLVELCRPSHLRAGPFLRGFYFVGRRTVSLTSASSPEAIAAQTMIRPATAFSASATSILRPEDAAAPGQWESGTMIQSPAETRQALQWVFLSHLFSHIFLQDHAALGASGASSRGNFWRRILLASAAVFFAILSVGFLVSFVSNRMMESEIVNAARGIHFAPQPSSQLASIDDLKTLEALRQPLQTLSTYEQQGVPWHLRWGLYTGHDLYSQGRAVYFDRFRQLLFGQTQEVLRRILVQLPSVPGPSDDYETAYSTLKAYAITTSNPEKATRDFLSPILMKTWLAGRSIDDQRRQLAQQQIDFYSDQLAISNPYSGDYDAQVVGRSRNYLAQFAATQRIYHAMLADASKAVPGLNFNRKYPDAAEVVKDSHQVEGGFTKAGWNFMQDAFIHSDKYMKGEVWVLGDQTRASSTSAGLEQDLRASFQKDYIQQWRDFLNAAMVLRSAAYQDEAKKLAILSGNRSPLLMLLCEVSENTAVSSPDVTKAFLPTQQVVPAPCQNRVVQQPNENYVRALNAAQTCLEQIQPSLPSDQRDAALNQCNTLSGQARTAADQIAQIFAIDQDGKVDVTVKHLLEAPTTAAPPPPPPGLSGEAQFCGALRSLGSKYPFNPAAPQEASLGDLAGLFQPGSTGALSKFLDQNKGAIDLQGSQYAVKGKPDPVLTAVINRAAGIQRALYPGTSPQMQYQFTLKAHPEPEISTEVITIEGQSLKVAGNEQSSKTFTWSGNGAEAGLSINGVSYGQFSGLWAAFHLFDNYAWSYAPAGFHLTWQVRGFGGQVATINGKPLVAQFDLEAGDVPLFERGYLSALKCPTR